MKATVIGVDSGSKYADGKRRILLEFEDADKGLYSSVRFPAVGPLESAELDGEITFTILNILNVGRPQIPLDNEQLF